MHEQMELGSQCIIQTLLHRRFPYLQNSKEVRASMPILYYESCAHCRARNAYYAYAVSICTFVLVKRVN